MTRHEHPQPAAGARRRRPLLITLSAVGLATGLLGMAGVFAVATDRATTGEAHVESASFSEAELKIAEASGPSTDGETCGEFVDDLTSPLFDFVETSEPSSAWRYLCLRNDAEVGGDLSSTVIDLVDSEVACTGEEASVDETCGTGVGELSQVLLTHLSECDGTHLGTADLTDMINAAVPLRWIGPGETMCLSVNVAIDAADVDARRPVQSDESTWRFAFDFQANADGTTACSPTDPEPNDSQETALTYVGPEMAGNICTNDEDWYRFDSLSDFSATLAFSNAAGDLDLYLYDAAGFPLAASESVDDSESVSGASGTYYLQVVGFEGTPNVPGYTLTISGGEAPPTCDPIDAEPNNNRPAAIDFQAPSMSGNICADDEDWYRIDSLYPFTMDVLFSHADGDLDVTLYDSSLNQVAVGQSVNDNETVSASSGGVYYLRIHGFQGAANIPGYTAQLTSNP